MKNLMNILIIVFLAIYLFGCSDKMKEPQSNFIYLTENRDTLLINYSFKDTKENMLRIEWYYQSCLKNKEAFYIWTDTLYEHIVGIFRKNSPAYFLDARITGKIDASLWIPYNFMDDKNDTIQTITDWMQGYNENHESFRFTTDHIIVCKGKVYNQNINDSLLVIERISKYEDNIFEEVIYYESHLIPVEYIFKFPSYDNKVYHYYLQNKDILKKVDNLKEFKKYF